MASYDAGVSTGGKKAGRGLFLFHLRLKERALILRGGGGDWLLIFKNRHKIPTIVARKGESSPFDAAAERGGKNTLVRN